MRKLLLIAIVALAGCATTPKYQWTSSTGEKCFYSCKSRAAECKSRAFDIPGLVQCENSEGYCMKACPDVEEIAKQ